MERIDEIYSNPGQRNNITIWEDLLKDSHLNNPEIRGTLLYRTFYYFLEKLSAQTGVESSAPVNNDVVRLFADRFEWIKEEASLAGHYGSSQINFIFSYAYGEPAEPHQNVVPVSDHRKGKYLFSLVRLLIISSVLIFVVIYSLENYTGKTVNPDVPYYACKILFSKNAKRTNYTDCEAMAKAGDDKAQLLFGLAQIYSRNFEKKPELAIDWLTRSANQSNSMAMYMLGALQGEDLKIQNKVRKQADFESAKYWLDRAANAGQKNAYTYLASLYVTRGDSYADLLQAREKLVVAANSEQPDAYFAMALFELYGLVSKVNYELSRKWLDLYARNSVPEGSNDAAWLLATSPDGNFRDAGQAAQYIELLLKDPGDRNLYMYLDTVAAVDAANGKFDAAVDFQQQAINVLKRLDKDVYQSNIDGFQKRLSLYKNHRTWTEDLPDGYVKLGFEGIKNRIFSRELRDIVLKTH